MLWLILCFAVIFCLGLAKFTLVLCPQNHHSPTPHSHLGSFVCTVSILLHLAFVNKPWHPCCAGCLHYVEACHIFTARCSVGGLNGGKTKGKEWKWLTRSINSAERLRPSFPSLAPLVACYLHMCACPQLCIPAI